MKPRDTAVVAIFLGPAAAAADQLVSYVLVYPAAARSSNAVLHLVTAVAATLAAAGVVISYRVLRRRTEVFEVDRFLALVGVAINVFFLLVVLVGYGLPKLMLHPTD